jgi:hypothetical protein
MITIFLLTECSPSVKCLLRQFQCHGRQVRHSISPCTCFMSRGATERFCVGEKNLWHLNFSAAAAHAWPFSSRAGSFIQSEWRKHKVTRLWRQNAHTVGDAYIFLLLAPLVTRDRSSLCQCVCGCEEQKAAGLASAPTSVKIIFAALLFYAAAWRLKRASWSDAFWAVCASEKAARLTKKHCSHTLIITITSWSGLFSSATTETNR